MRENIKLTEIYNNSQGVSRLYSLREIYINPQQVICLRSEEHYQQMLQEGRLIDGLDSGQSFTRISVSNNSYEQDIVVVGTIDEVYRKLNIETRKLLRG